MDVNINISGSFVVTKGQPHSFQTRLKKGILCLINYAEKLFLYQSLEEEITGSPCWQ